MGKCNGDRTTDGVCTGVGGGDGCYTTTEERIELLGCSDWRRLQILDNCNDRKNNQMIELPEWTEALIPEYQESGEQD